MCKTRWLNTADKQFGNHLDYIKESSHQNAEKVAREILQMVDAIHNNPEANGLDKYKINNNGSFRYFEKHHLRIAYQIKPNEIVILRCRHTSMKPRNY